MSFRIKRKEAYVGMLGDDGKLTTGDTRLAADWAELSAAPLVELGPGTTSADETLVDDLVTYTPATAPGAFATALEDRYGYVVEDA